VAVSAAGGAGGGGAFKGKGSTLGGGSSSTWQCSLCDQRDLPMAQRNCDRCGTVYVAPRSGSGGGGGSGTTAMTVWEAGSSSSHPMQVDNSTPAPGGLFGSAGVPTRPAGYTGDGSRTDSGIPPAASRQLHSLAQVDDAEEPREVDSEQVALLAAMGFEVADAGAALRAHRGDAQAAANALLRGTVDRQAEAEAAEEEEEEDDGVIDLAAMLPNDSSELDPEVSPLSKQTRLEAARRSRCVVSAVGWGSGE
jgi:hypothetical protein